jgi:hypothetical protein
MKNKTKIGFDSNILKFNNGVGLLKTLIKDYGKEYIYIFHEPYFDLEYLNSYIKIANIIQLNEFYICEDFIKEKNISIVYTNRELDLYKIENLIIHCFD